MAEYDDKDLYGDYTYEDSETPANVSALVAAFRNLTVNSAMIENLAVQDAHIQSVSVNKIEAGELMVDSNNLAFNALWKKDTTGWALGTNVARATGMSFAFRGFPALHSNQSGLASDAWRGGKSDTDYRVSCQENEEFTASVYYWTPYLSTFTGNSELSALGIELEWYNSNGSRISSVQTGMDAFEGNTSPTQPWKRASVTGKAPAGAVTAGINFWVRRNGRCYFSAPQLQRGKFLTEFTDNGTYIGPNGIMTTDLKFSGSLEGATGTFSGSLSAATGSFSGDIDGANITGSSGEFRRIDMASLAGVPPYFTFATGSVSSGPGQKVELVTPNVNNIKWQLDTTGTGTLRFDIDGLLYVQDVRVTSTATAKTNIKRLDEEYDSLSMIDETIYTYYYKNDVDNLNFGNKQAGLIAEGIHPLLKGGDSQTINLYAVTSVLWDAVNKLKKRIEALEALNAAY